MNDPQPDDVARRRADPLLGLEAINRGVRAALLDHKRAGNPIAVWQDGRVVWIAPEDIAVDSEPDG